MKIKWPNNKKFAFSIVDDTDNGTIFNTKPVYDLLYNNGIVTTKTAWAYPSRDSFYGGCLLDGDYLDYILELSNKGFEIGMHNVGSGCFNREEILKGIEIFKEKLGFYPKLHINHASNPDNIYWGRERYQIFLKNIMTIIYDKKRNYYGSDENSKHFWGDVCKDKIKYIRNYTFNDINTLKKDPKMPYIDTSKSKYSNYWFSSSDGHTVQEFNSLLQKNNVDRLEKEEGACIVYTHFGAGFVNKQGEIDSEFTSRVKYLSEKNGWFVPATTLLDYLMKQNQNPQVSKMYLTKLDINWLTDRIIKRFIFKR